MKRITRQNQIKKRIHEAIIGIMTMLAVFIPFALINEMIESWTISTAYIIICIICLAWLGLVTWAYQE